MAEPSDKLLGKKDKDADELKSLSIRELDRRKSLASGTGRRPPKNPDGTDQIKYGSKANLAYRAKIDAEYKRRSGK